MQKLISNFSLLKPAPLLGQTKLPRVLSLCCFLNSTVFHFMWLSMVIICSVHQIFLAFWGYGRIVLPTLDLDMAMHLSLANEMEQKWCVSLWVGGQWATEDTVVCPLMKAYIERIATMAVSLSSFNRIKFSQMWRENSIQKGEVGNLRQVWWFCSMKSAGTQALSRFLLTHCCNVIIILISQDVC